MAKISTMDPERSIDSAKYRTDPSYRERVGERDQARRRRDPLQRYLMRYIDEGDGWQRYAHDPEYRAKVDRGFEELRRRVRSRPARVLPFPAPR